jgi:hypothetical protein
MIWLFLVPMLMLALLFILAPLYDGWQASKALSHHTEEAKKYQDLYKSWSRK